MSLVLNIAERAQRRSKGLRARIVPAVSIMLFMMVLAVGFLTDSASAAAADNDEGLNVGGDPILLYILVIVAIACLILWKISDEELLLYSFIGCLIGAVVVFYVH